VLERALALDPRDPRLLLRKAAIRQRAKDDPGALAALDLAILYGARDPRVWFARGRLHLERFADPAAAVPDLARAARLDPDNASIWYHYGLALYRHQDCRAQGALTRYRDLCAAGSACRAELPSLAAQALDFMASPKICPAPQGRFAPAAGGP
jgi:tetratricopeptide (TPR) repeat protein